jgi:hypothetical protein
MLRRRDNKRWDHEKGLAAPWLLANPWRPKDFTTRVSNIMESMLLLDASLSSEVNFLRLHLGTRPLSSTSDAPAASVSSTDGVAATVCGDSTASSSAAAASPTLFSTTVVSNAVSPTPAIATAGSDTASPAPASTSLPNAFAFMMKRQKTSPAVATTCALKPPASTTTTSSKLNYKPVPAASVRELLQGAARARKLGKASEADDIAMGALNQSPSTRVLFSGPDGRSTTAVAVTAKVATSENRKAYRAAKSAADALFVGDSSHVLRNLTKLQDRPDYREALRVLSAANKDTKAAPSKRTQAMECVVHAVASFFEKAMHATGSRTSADQNAVGAVLCAIVDSSMFD